MGSAFDARTRPFAQLASSPSEIPASEFLSPGKDSPGLVGGMHYSCHKGLALIIFHPCDVNRSSPCKDAGSLAGARTRSDPRVVTLRS